MYLFKLIITSFIVTSLLTLSPITIASDKLEGCFEATQSCEAYRSFRKKTNPENARLEVGKQYPLLAQNKPNAATHVQLEIEGLKSDRRWVALSCGRVLPRCSGQVITPPVTQTKGDDYLLAVSWQPAFCETHPSKTECKTLTPSRFDAQNLALHGLWPQPRNNAYCGVSVKDKSVDRRKRWDLLAPLKLSSKVRQELSVVMPGYASNLQRHEWIKHGTCYGTSENVYYADSLWMMRELNNSVVRDLFRSRIGQKLSIQDLRQSFDKAFGAGAGQKVNMRCDRKGRVGEIWVNLRGKVSSGISFKHMLMNAPKAKADCKSGVVDPA
ncbi:MAG: Ribonuclease I precursor (EC [uncultured Thiotrichaceae bacterium]|uniref:Ribonuclease I (EC) n=1 Tax=uncultured Thiotrichaceae bacterium TaxID=298394 RepID=A0A6S6TPV0_9GAMM|nr:MAG: Ribonuclease I precursor (EC [uncultured Thiotrichaceae bacterium]